MRNLRWCGLLSFLEYVMVALGWRRLKTKAGDGEPGPQLEPQSGIDGQCVPVRGPFPIRNLYGQSKGVALRWVPCCFLWIPLWLLATAFLATPCFGATLCGVQPCTPKIISVIDVKKKIEESPWQAFEYAFIHHYGVDPASSSTGTPPYYPVLLRQADCSLTRLVYDSTDTLVGQSSNYQDFLHQGLQIPTTADQFPNGCKDPTTGIAMENGAYVGKVSNGDMAIAGVSADGVNVAFVDSTDTVVSSQDYPVVPSGSSSAYVAGIASADLNGDGNPDIVVSSTSGSGAGTLTVLLNNGNGTFTTGQTFAAPAGATGAPGITLEDVNADGKVDLVAVGNPSSGSGLEVFLGNGNGTFQTPGITGPASAGGSLVISADFNGDGIPDLATDTGQILLGNGDGTFALEPQSLDTRGSQVRGLAAADFNKDGKMDLAFGNWYASTIDVYNGNGDGTFTYAASYPMIDGGTNLDASDLDGDGYPDLFVGTAQGGLYTFGGDSGSFFQSLLNYGDGTFGKGRAYLYTPGQSCPFSGCTGYSSYAVADFTGDGKPDIVTWVSNSSGTYLTVLKGKGDGTFQQPGLQTPITAGIGIESLAVADLNGDGKQDAVFAWNESSGSGYVGYVSVALGNGDGTFQKQTDYAAPSSIAYGYSPMVLADVNGDGKPDIVFLAGPSSSQLNPTNSLYVMLNKGDGTFSSPTLIDSKTNLNVIAAGDVNGDGDADIVAATNGETTANVPGAAYLYLSNGDGTFQTPVPLTLGSYFSGAAAVADVNGDGIPDIVFAGENVSFTGGNVEVLLGNGDGTFQSGVSTPHGDLDPTSIVVTDLSGDGKPDLVLGGGQQDDSSYAMEGNGDGTFQTSNAGFLYLGKDSSQLTLKDVNGDGHPDLFMVSAGGTVGSAVEVYLTSPAPALAATATTLNSSAPTITAGQPVTLTATVTSTTSGTPTGTVTFLDGTATLGTGTLNSSAQATFTTSSLAAGAHSITASYSGDSTFAASTSAALTETVNSVAASTTTMLSSSLNPSNAGQSVTFSATVTSSASGTPSGTVTFLDGSTTLGTGTLDSSAQATYTTSSLTAGTHSITASYSGDSTFAPSTSSALTQTVNAGAEDFSVTASPTTATVNAGQSAGYTLTLTPKNGFNQAVTLSCAGAPAHTTCTPASSSVTLNGSAASSVKFDVTTTARGMLAPVSFEQPFGPFSEWPVATLLLAAGLLIALSSRQRRRRWVLGTTVAFLLALALAGCGGGGTMSGGSTTNNGTTAGSYMLTLRGTSGSLTHSATVTLKVN